MTNSAMDTSNSLQINILKMGMSITVPKQVQRVE